jgi:hypothetical protein
MMHLAAAASYGVLLGRPRLPDGRDETCDGVSVSAATAVYLPLVMLLSVDALDAAATAGFRLPSLTCCSL